MKPIRPRDGLYHTANHQPGTAIQYLQGAILTVVFITTVVLAHFL